MRFLLLTSNVQTLEQVADKCSRVAQNFCPGCKGHFASEPVRLHIFTAKACEFLDYVAISWFLQEAGRR